MKTRIYILLVLISLVIVSCNNSENKEMEKLRKEITETENELYKKQEADPVIAKDIIDKYINFADTYPQDKMTPEYLFKAADVAMNFNEYKKSISCLSRIETDYPDYDKYATAIFLKGFIFENFLQNMVMARKYYDIIITDYPEHSLAQEARNRMDFMTLSDEELIKVFEQINEK